MILSYADHIYKLSYAFVKRDYTGVSGYVKSLKPELSYYIEEDGQVWGYQITRNEPVSRLYGFDAYVVRFYFSQIETLHSKRQQEIIEALFEKLNGTMHEVGGYYNLRIPAHLVDVIKAFGNVMRDGFLCGGTIEMAIYGTRVELPYREGLRCFFADREYVDSHRDRFESMTYQSFAFYQGQYHISPVTEHKAGEIYENWIRGYFDHFEENRILVTEYMGEPIGICTCGEDEHMVEGQLSAVDSASRKLGAYKTLLSTLINYGYEKGKGYAASTQLDNYISHGTFSSLGMKTCLSLYNYHFDLRK